MLCSLAADGLRLACADAGDTLDVANFDQGTADLMVLRLYVLNELVSTRAHVECVVSHCARACVCRLRRQ
jgi:hypothetical protein